jgi:hypothetical protein
VALLGALKIIPLPYIFYQNDFTLIGREHKKNHSGLEEKKMFALDMVDQSENKN